MPVYQINAASDGKKLTLGTTDNAVDALGKLQGAIKSYERAWVSDEWGKDVDPDHLAARANEERWST